ncbi:MAG: hypothetical protein IPJ16_13080 [Bacteroidales bacterium]|nr:hypothetical protein [Bacteroidales bacterium]
MSDTDVTQEMIDSFINEKFPEQTEEEDFSNPMTAANQVNRIKENYMRTHPGIDTKFKRLLAGKGFQ